MARLKVGTKHMVNAVEKIHAQLTGRLQGQAAEKEKKLYELIHVAANLGPKKGIVQENRVQELCEYYIALFGDMEH